MSSLSNSPDLDKILRGSLENLPPLESNVIRIFLSSTFTDYSEERNVITREAVPELRKYCQQKGFDFLISDMRWGIRDEAQLDQQTMQLCLKEISNCQKLSSGPSFVVLLGDKYGYRPFPSQILAEEFHLLKAAAKKDCINTSVLDECFIQDDNALPPVYTLQPITTKFPYYGDDTEENAEKNAEDVREWTAVSDLLASTFRAVATSAYRHGMISQAQKHKYYSSATEKEVDTGILRNDDATGSTLCFQRTFQNIIISDTIAGRFQDLEGGLADTEASELLADLKAVKIPNVLQSDNVSYFEIDWTSCGIDPEMTQHAQYLANFKNTFLEKVKLLVDQSLENSGNTRSYELLREVLLHAHFCVNKISNFNGRADSLSEIKTKMLKVYEFDKSKDSDEPMAVASEVLGLTANASMDNTENTNPGEHSELNMQKQYLMEMGVTFNLEEDELTIGDEKVKELLRSPLITYKKPLIIHGLSGSGKTCLLAKVAVLVKQWLGKGTVTILRFLGTSPQSASIRETLTSICYQILETYNIQRPIMVDFAEDFSFLVLYFTSLLHRIDTSDRPLVIILDSVDQLSSLDHAYSLHWLPKILPPNVYIIASMVTNLHGCLESIQMALSDPDRFVSLGDLAKETAVNILKSWCTSAGRKLTEAQLQLLLNAFQGYPQPLYLKLAYEQAKLWKSYTPLDDCVLGRTTETAVEEIFLRLERNHGELLISKALGFLTASKCGLTDVEIEDVLSCDDEVLQDTYLYHLPPDATLIRLPSLLWRRVRYDLEEYLVERQADGKDVVTWYHRQFREAALRRYASDDVICKRHSSLADYFMGRWSEVCKPLELYKKKEGNYPDAMRGVPRQPIVYKDCVYNRRKMSELPFQLVASNRYAEFLDEICHNFEWLYYKIKATSLNEILNDLKFAIDRMREYLTDESLQKPAGTTVAEDKEISENRCNDIQVLESQHLQTSPKKCDVEEQLVAVQRVYDLLLLGDQIKRDATSLPIQLLGQLNDEDNLTDGICRLRQESSDWLRKDARPYLVPHTKCLPTPGNNLRSSIELTIFYSGDALENEKKMALTADGKTLMGIDRQKKGGDILKCFDLENSGLVSWAEQLHGLDIKWIDLVGNDRYLYVDVYEHRDKYSPRYRPFVLDLGKQQPILFPSNATPIAFSNSGKYCLLAPTAVLTADPTAGPTVAETAAPTVAQTAAPTADLTATPPPVLDLPPKEVTSKKKKVPTGVEVAVVYDLENQKSTSLKINMKKKIDSQKNTPQESSWKKISEVKQALFTPNDKYVYVQFSDGQYVFEVESGKLVSTLPTKESTFPSQHNERTSLRKVTYALPDNMLLTPGMDYDTRKNLYQFDLTTGEVWREMIGHNYGIGLVTVNDNQTMAASACTDDVIVNGVREKFLCVWDLVTGQRVSKSVQQSSYSAIAFCGRDDDFLLSATTASHEIIMWYIGTPLKPCHDSVPVYQIFGHTNTVVYLKITPDSETLITGSVDNTIKFWELKSMVDNNRKRLNGVSDYSTLREEFNKVPDAPYKRGEGKIATTCTTISKDGRTAAVGTADGWVIFYDLESQEMIRYDKAGSGGRVMDVITSSSGRHFISAADAVKIWNSRTGDLIRVPNRKPKIETYSQGPGAGGRSISCIAEAAGVLVVGYGGMECYGVIWNVETGAHIRTLEGLYGFSQVAILSDASKVISTFFDFPVIFKASDGEMLNDMANMDTMMYSCTCLRVSPSDQLVVSCSSDGSVKVMHIPSRKYLFRMQHKSSVVEARFTNDSKVLVTCGFKNILVWSMSSGKLLNILTRHTDFITRMRFSSDDRFLVSCAKDKQIVVWDFRDKSSVAGFHAHCTLEDVSVADDLSCVLFAPQSVAYLGVLKPNPVLSDILGGKLVRPISETVQQAQAYALAFSSQKVAQQTSKACVLL